MPLTESTKIVENGIVATGDSSNRIGPYALLIRNDRIVDVAQHAEPLKHQNPNAEVVDAKGKLILPGFVDAHYHGESFLLRHLIGNAPMARWERDRRFSAANAYFHADASREDLDALYRLSWFNALKSGITCIADFGLDHLESSPNAGFDAMKRTELKGIIGLHNGDQVEKGRLLQSQSVRFAVAITGDDDLTTYTLQTALRSAGELKLPLLVHLGETRRAFETLKKNFRRTVLQLLNEYHIFSLRVQLVHCSVFEGEDFDILTNARIPLIVTPSSALMKDVDIPPVGEFLVRNIPMALGSDWGPLDPFLNLRSLVAIARSQGKPVPGAFELLAMATRNGARALGFQNELGSIEPGKKADLTFIDIADSRRAFSYGNGPSANLLHEVLMECTSRDVSDVMVNGNFYVRKGTVLTYSEEDLLADGNRLLARLTNRFPNKESSVAPEPVVREATILTFEPSPEQADNADEAAEGFQVIRKGNDDQHGANRIVPIQPEAPKPLETPKTVRRIFGEDDL